MDVDELELLDAHNIERQRVKQHVFGQPKKTVSWEKINVSVAILLGITTITSLTLPSVAAKIPLLNNVMSFIGNDLMRFNNFEQFSNAIALTQESNGIKMTIDEASYFSSSTNPLRVEGAAHVTGSNKLSPVPDTNYYVGMMNYINMSFLCLNVTN